MGEQAAGLSDLVVSVDVGTTTAVVSFQFSGSKDKHLLQFPSPTNTEKRTEELDATVARSQSKWHFGQDVRFLSDVTVFENIKLAIIGEQPYKDLLTAALRDAAKEHGVIATPVTLFTKFFAYILEVLEQQFLDAPGSEHFCHGRSFHEIPKHCWVTYPVRHNESLRIMLVEAALAAKIERENGDLKFDGVNGVSESLAAAYCVKFGGKHNVLASETTKTMLIVDCGGGSTDAAAVYFDSEGRIELACPTDGFQGGGHMINKAARAWLREQFPGNRQFEDDDAWTSTSTDFEGCKRVFDGISPVKMLVAGQAVTIGRAEMTGFFQPLKENILQLVRNQHNTATRSGHPPGDFVLCGGPARNRWFAEMIFKEIQQRHPEIRCAAEVAVGTVAKGALYYAQHPVAEVTVARENIGLTYLEDQSPTGRPLGGDRVDEGVGWVYKQGEPTGRESHVELMKTIYRSRPGRPNHYISSTVYATKDGFPQERIMTNKRTTWNCDITYPITGLRSHLSHLGSIEAEIPHNELFPSGTSHDRVEARFIFSIKPEGQLLKVDVSLKREGDTPLRINRVFVPAASWTTESELDAENNREGRDEPRDSFPLPRKRRGRPRRSLTQRKMPRTGSPMPNRHNISPTASFASQHPRKVSPSRYAQHREDPPAGREDQYTVRSSIEDQSAIELPPLRHVVARGREKSLTL